MDIHQRILKRNKHHLPDNRVKAMIGKSQKTAPIIICPPDKEFDTKLKYSWTNKVIVDPFLQINTKVLSLNEWLSYICSIK